MYRESEGGMVVVGMVVGAIVVGASVVDCVVAFGSGGWVVGGSGVVTGIVVEVEWLMRRI